MQQEMYTKECEKQGQYCQQIDKARFQTREKEFTRNQQKLGKDVED